MEKDECNSEADNLAIGHAKADYLIRKYGSIENVPKLINKEEGKANPLEKTLEILKETHPDLVNFGNGRVFERILKRIVKTGYIIKNGYGIPIKDFSKIDGPQKRNIYISLKKDFNLL